MKKIKTFEGIEDFLKNFDIYDLDDFEYMQYDDMVNNRGFEKEFALRILINTVEGDFTQLSPKLAKIAKKKIVN
jgi:hypothetical protein